MRDEGVFGGAGQAIFQNIATDGNDELRQTFQTEYTHAPMMTGFTWEQLKTLDAADRDALLAKIPLVFDDLQDARSTSVEQAPSAGLESPDVYPMVDTIKDRRNVFLDELAGYDQDKVEAIYAKAKTIAEDFVSVTDLDIDGYMTAFEQRSKAHFQRSVSRATTGMWDVRGVMNTQFSMMLANMEQDRQIELDDMEARLRMLQAQDRSQQTVQVARDFMSNEEFRINALNAMIGAEMDISKFEIISEQDKLEWDLDMETRARLWNLELYSYAGNLLASGGGAVSMPRAQTAREKVLGAFTTSVSFGMNLGVNTRNPAVGVAGGLGMFAAQLWAANGGR